MKIIAIIGFCITLCFFTISTTFAFEDGDFQFWNTEIIEGKVNDSLKVKVEEELRFGDDISELYYTYTDGGFTYKVNEYLDLGANYRQIFEKKSGEWKEENRPHVNGTIKWNWQGYKFSNRGRVELRCQEDKDDAWRYRNKFSVSFPWKWTEFDIQPYIADEIFIDFHGDKFNRNRLYAGFKLKIIKHLKADIFYLWQTSESTDDWTDYNVIGIKLTASF